MVMVSMCLAGIKCRYDGGAKKSTLIDRLAADGQDYVLFCPESLGDLTIPREPAEIVGGTGEDVLDGKAQVIDRSGKNVTEAFLKGAEKALEMAEKYQPTAIYMKTRSPSCGTGEIYDGTFSKTKIHGDGVAAALLKRKGFTVIPAD